MLLGCSMTPFHLQSLVKQGGTVVSRAVTLNSPAAQLPFLLM
jgi:hypothetical protein